MARWTPSRSSRLGALLVACTLALVSTPALSQKPASVGAKKVDPDEAKARMLFKDGQTAYDVGEFERALALYAEAYKVKPLPGFLFNIGQCHRQLDNFKEAAFFFGRFIENSKPDAANLDLARELMAEMNRRLEAPKGATTGTGTTTPGNDTPTATHLEPTVRGDPVLPPPPPPPLEEVPLYKKGWFWAVVGGGVVVVAGGVTAAVLASQPRTVPYVPTVTSLADIDARTIK
jgi:hypothetical protein